MLKIICIILVALAMPTWADEETKPGVPYDLSTETVIMHGMPGDEGFYEEHIQDNGTVYFVDAEGKTIPIEPKLAVK